MALKLGGQMSSKESAQILEECHQRIHNLSTPQSKCQLKQTA